MKNILRIMGFAIGCCATPLLGSDKPKKITLKAVNHLGVLTPVSVILRQEPPESVSNLKQERKKPVENEFRRTSNKLFYYSDQGDVTIGARIKDANKVIKTDQISSIKPDDLTGKTIHIIKKSTEPGFEIKLESPGYMPPVQEKESPPKKEKIQAFVKSATDFNSTLKITDDSSPQKVISKKPLKVKTDYYLLLNKKEETGALKKYNKNTITLIPNLPRGVQVTNPESVDIKAGEFKPGYKIVIINGTVAIQDGNNNVITASNSYTKNSSVQPTGKPSATTEQVASPQPLIEEEEGDEARLLPTIHL